MQTIRLKYNNIKECATKVAEVLRAGGIVLYPTDTLYGLGADALSNEAVDKIYTIKGREEGKPVHCIVADLKMAAEYGEINQFAEMLAKAFLPGPLTLILYKRARVGTGIGRTMTTIGLRIPNNKFCLEMAKQFGGPITTTSANISGHAPLFSVGEIVSQLNSAARIDLLIDAGILPVSKPSTIVDLTGKEPVILREGVISPAEIWEAIRVEL